MKLRVLSIFFFAFLYSCTNKSHDDLKPPSLKTTEGRLAYSKDRADIFMNKNGRKYSSNEDLNKAYHITTEWVDQNVKQSSLNLKIKALQDSLLKLAKMRHEEFKEKKSKGEQ